LRAGAARDEAAGLRGDLIGFGNILNRYPGGAEDPGIPAILDHAIHL
jgi:hypothetical protein